MDNQKNDDSVDPQVRAIYPELNEAQLKIAAENLDRYILIIAGIIERECAEKKEKDSSPPLEGSSVKEE